jgi:hypothetical protein
MVEYTFLQPIHYQIEAHEILREYRNLPHMLLRIQTRGGRFPLRDVDAFARIENGRRVTRALFCEIDDDESSLRAYFPTDVVLRGRLVLGYGSEVTVVIPLDRTKLRAALLDSKRIEGRFHRVTLRDLGVFRVQRRTIGPDA